MRILDPASGAISWWTKLSLAIPTLALFSVLVFEFFHPKGNLRKLEAKVENSSASQNYKRALAIDDGTSAPLVHSAPSRQPASVDDCRKDPRNFCPPQHRL